MFGRVEFESFFGGCHFSCEIILKQLSKKRSELLAKRDHGCSGMPETAVLSFAQFIYFAMYIPKVSQEEMVKSLCEIHF